MPHNIDIDDDLQEMPEFGDDEAAGEVEEIPEIPAPKKPSTRKKSAVARTVHKEFDIRAAHAAWKEKNGIEDDYGW